MALRGEPVAVLRVMLSSVADADRLSTDKRVKRVIANHFLTRKYN